VGKSAGRTSGKTSYHSGTINTGHSFFSTYNNTDKKKPSQFFALLRKVGQLTVFTIRIGWFFASLFCPHFLYLGGRGYFFD
jgi:hypothetical protein